MNSHAIVSGSLGQRNVGDDSLLKAFLGRFGARYKAHTILSAGLLQDMETLRNTASTSQILPVPRFPIGKRFWAGFLQRIATRKRIVARSVGADRHYVTVGGVLGNCLQINSHKYQEWRWALSFSARLIHYFGDVGDGFEKTAHARRLTGLMNRENCWIAVRSAEAAQLLNDSGLRQPIHVGLDPVLFERANSWGLPFIRRCPVGSALAIVPCAYWDEAAFRPVWLAAAREAVAAGLSVRWVSLADPTDLPLCRELSRQHAACFPTHPQSIVCGPDAETGIRDAAVCVASRYHGTIFGICNGVPTIAVADASKKVCRLFRLLGLSDWNLTLDDRGTLESRVRDLIRAALNQQWEPNLRLLTQEMDQHRAALAHLECFLGREQSPT